MGKIMEECKYSIAQLENDECSKRMLKQQRNAAIENTRLNFQLLRELVDTIESKTLEELEVAYKQQLSQLQLIYKADRELGYRHHFWMVKSMEEAAMLGNPAIATPDITRKLYTSSEELLQSGFELLTEFERRRTDKLHSASLLCKALNVTFATNCLDPLEGFAAVGYKDVPFMDQLGEG